jgi:hypothetical protein
MLELFIHCAFPFVLATYEVVVLARASWRRLWIFGLLLGSGLLVASVWCPSITTFDHGRLQKYGFFTAILGAAVLGVTLTARVLDGTRLPKWLRVTLAGIPGVVITMFAAWMS